jgi:ABC-type uncharacterized transport system fused permease/ATPase subunit
MDIPQVLDESTSAINPEGEREMYERTLEVS